MAQLRVAYMYQPNTLIGLAQTFLDLLRNKAQRHFFAGDRDAEAIAWLLENP
jgi:hypothetical protein